MGCGESRPKLVFDDFKPSDKEEARVDKESIQAVWTKKYPVYELTSAELTDLVPSAPITEENSDEAFPPFQAKFLKLADRKRRIDELAKNPKPFIKQYMAELDKELKPLWGGEGVSAWDIAFSCKGANVEAKYASWYDRVGKPLIAKSFDHHDAKGDGVLDPDESKVFFEHLVSDLIEKQVLLLSCAVFQTVFDQLARVSKTKSEMNRVIEVWKLQQQRGQLGAASLLENAKKKYMSNKEEMNKEAFGVMDTNGDGALQLTEVQEALRPLSAKHKKFLNAFGFDVDADLQQEFKKYVESPEFQKTLNENEKEEWRILLTR